MTSTPSGTPAEGNDGVSPAGAGGDAVRPTSRQKRRAGREARRQAKDALYELRRERKKAKDGTSLHGHHIVDSTVLAEAFPEPETPEFRPASVRLRIFHGVILVLLLAMVVTAVVLVGMVQRGDLEVSIGSWKPTATPVTCPAATLDYAPNATVTVNVFNGGSVEGRAGQVAEELRKRGFLVQNVANKSTEHGAPAVVVSGAAGYAAAFTMQQNIPDTEYVQDEREDATVDVILTSNYSALVAEPKVNQKSGVLSCPRLSPPPPAVSVPAPAAAGAPAEP